MRRARDGSRLVFLRTLSGIVFFDYGGAYSQLAPNKPTSNSNRSIGAELWVDAVTTSLLTTNLRLGIAHPLEDGAPAFESYAVNRRGFLSVSPNSRARHTPQSVDLVETLPASHAEATSGP